MVKKTTMVQVDLKRADGVEMTTWVDKRPDLKEGVLLSLKDEDKDVFWRVNKVYDIEMDKDQVEKNRGWDNNNYEKHDGTAMKDRKNGSRKV